MIVVDVNVIAYLLIDGPFTQAARLTLKRDPHWIAPILWKHEFLNILATSVREHMLEEGTAMAVLANSTRFVQDEVIEPPRRDVLRLAVSSRIATYDCEYIVLAQRVGQSLVTADKALIRSFPDVAVSLVDFAAGK